MSVVFNESQHLKEKHGINITILETFHKTAAFCFKHNFPPPPSLFVARTYCCFLNLPFFTVYFCREERLWEVTGLPVSAQKTFSKISQLHLISCSSAQRPYWCSTVTSLIHFKYTSEVSSGLCYPGD